MSLAVLVLSLAAAMTPQGLAAANPSPTMTYSEIKAHNSKLGTSDPAYIRCVRARETTARSGYMTICRYNASWQWLEQAKAASSTVAEPVPSSMSYADIRAFNARLPGNHRYFIRCVRSTDIGSLIPRNVSCRTNEQWKEAERVANENAREISDRFKPTGNP